MWIQHPKTHIKPCVFTHSGFLIRRINKMDDKKKNHWFREIVFDRNNFSNSVLGSDSWKLIWKRISQNISLVWLWDILIMGKLYFRTPCILFRHLNRIILGRDLTNTIWGRTIRANGSNNFPPESYLHYSGLHYSGNRSGFYFYLYF